MDQSPLVINYDSGLEIRARDYFRILHKKQVRKYTKFPYFVHLDEVANLIRTIPHTSVMVAASYGHDSIEDQGLEHWRLVQLFGIETANLINDLSDKYANAPFPRQQRKYAEHERLASCRAESQNIKLCDVLSNTKSIVEHDRSFAKLYLSEKLHLVQMLERANSDLRERTFKQLHECVSKLSN